MKHVVFTFIALLAVVGLSAQPSRKEVKIPDILGYKTLKCDLHMHTVFSDGLVWPTYRIDEAWQEGLDAIAITDHIEYRPYLKEDLNRSYDIAAPRAKDLDILLIRGVEITKSMPPGHLNALFITDANAVEDKDAKTSIQNAAKQGAFITWNHPGWKAQQPDTVRWWDIHTELYNQKQINGIEVVGYESEYFPEAQRWAMEKKLTMIGGTDIHSPIKNEFNGCGEHRTMTIAFAKERTLDALKEALFAGRTVVYAQNMLYGRKEFLEPIFRTSISVKKAKLRYKKYAYLMVYNDSDVPYEFVAKKGGDLSCIKHVVLKPHQTTLVEVRGITEQVSTMKEVTLGLVLKNLWIDVETPLELSITLENDLME